MYVENLGVVVISPNRRLLTDLFTDIPLRGFVALALLYDPDSFSYDLHYLKPEIIIIDDTFRGISAAKIVQQVRAADSREFSKPIIVVLSDVKKNEYISFCYSNGADYYMEKPLFGSTIWMRISELVSGRVRDQAGRASELYQKSGGNSSKVMRLTSKLLYELGCSPKSRGFTYLCYGISSIVNHTVNISVHSNDYYSHIGAKYSVPSMNVRHSVHDSLKKIDVNIVNRFLEEQGLTEAFGDGASLLSSGIRFSHFAAYIITEETEKDKKDIEKENENE